MSRNSVILFIRMSISRLRSFTASEQREEPSPRSTPGEADLGNPVVQTTALLTEQVQLLQSWVLPRPLSWVLYKQGEERGFSHMVLSESITYKLLQ